MSLTLGQRLNRAMSRIATRDLIAAEGELRNILSEDPNVSEARELLEVLQRARSGAAVADPAGDFKAGAEAFAAGKTRKAIELWKGSLATEPDKRNHQLVFLLATTLSAERRKACAQEILALGKTLLGEGHSAEAYALLLVAQSANQQSEAGRPGKTGQETGYTPSGSEDVFFEIPDVPSSTEDTQPEGVAFTPLTESLEPIPLKQTPRPTAAALSRESTPAKPDAKTAAGPDSEKALFTAPEGQEREAALFDAREAESGRYRDASSTRYPLASSDSRRAARRPPWSTYRGWWIGGAVVLLLAAVVTALLTARGDRVPTEALEEAASYLNAGQYALATNAYSKILKTYGDVAPAFLGRGRAQIASGNLDEGLADLARAVELHPKTTAVAEELADVLYTRGRFVESVQYYQHALAAGDVSAESLYRLGSSLVQINRSDEALDHLQSALSKRASHGEARLLYGTLLNAKGRFVDAERVLRATRSPSEAGGDYYLELGIALLEQGKLEEAEVVTRDFLKQSSGDARPLTLLGEIYLKRKQYEAARLELIRALRINPKEPRAQIALGRTWLAIGRIRRDRNDLAKARQILVDAEGVHEGDRLLTLGEISLAEGDTETASRLIEQSLSHGANPLSARIALAVARLMAEDLVGAANELQRAQGLAPSDPGIALSLGLVYSQLKDPRRAAEEYLSAIQGVGMATPAAEGSGPVVLPQPYIPLPARFDINRSIRAAYRLALSENEEDPTALTLKALAESASFIIGGTS